MVVEVTVGVVHDLKRFPFSCVFKFYAGEPFYGKVLNFKEYEFKELSELEKELIRKIKTVHYHAETYKVKVGNLSCVKMDILWEFIDSKCIVENWLFQVVKNYRMLLVEHREFGMFKIKGRLKKLKISSRIREIYLEKKRKLLWW